MPESSLIALGGLSLAIWIYLLAFRDGFWRADQRLDPGTTLDAWPAVVALVPARNEAPVIGRALGSLLTQDSPGSLRVILIDDHSEDGTAETAQRAAAELGQADRLTIESAPPLPSDWAGKLWALNHGMGRAQHLFPDARYYWLSDADIVEGARVLRQLVAKAERERCDLVSLMAYLSSEGLWARLLIPPFVFFFQKLYPFPGANDRRRKLAASAGGCVLVSAEALEASGGFAPIRSEIIDDCALARQIKGHAREGDRGTWIGLTTETVSIRPYRDLADVWAMVARSAYAQLQFSPLWLAGTVLGMIVIYLVPPLLTLTAPLHQDWWAAGLSLAAWALMSALAWPTYRLYREAPWRILLLPLAGALYTAMTVDSAVQHGRGRGGLWKGRAQAAASANRGNLEGGAPSG